MDETPPDVKTKLGPLSLAREGFVILAVTVLAYVYIAAYESGRAAELGFPFSVTIDLKRHVSTFIVAVLLYLVAHQSVRFPRFLEKVTPPKSHPWILGVLGGAWLIWCVILIWRYDAWPWIGMVGIMSLFGGVALSQGMLRRIGTESFQLAPSVLGVLLLFVGGMSWGSYMSHTREVWVVVTNADGEEFVYMGHRAGYDLVVPLERDPLGYRPAFRHLSLDQSGVIYRSEHLGRLAPTDPE